MTPEQADQEAVTVYEFNPQGFVTKKTDALDNRIEYVRTTGPQTQEVKVFEGGTTLSRTLTFGYTMDGRLSERQATVAGGETVTETWDYEGRFTSLHQLVSSAETAKIFKTDLDFFYDAAGRPTNIQTIKRRKGDNGSGGDVFVTTTMSYHTGHGQLATVTPPAVSPADNLTIQRLYYTAADDAPPVIRNGLLKRIEILSGSPAAVDPHLSRDFDYDAAGNVATITDARGHTTHLAWDGRGRLVRETREMGASSTEWESTLFRYGAPTQTGTTPGEYLLEVETGALGEFGTATAGRITRFQRDARGNVLTVERKDGASYVVRSSHAYDSDDNRIESQETTGTGTRTLVFGYDKMSRLRSVADGGSNETLFDYDAMGNRTKVTEALAGQVTDFVYDALDRLIEVHAQGPDPDEITEFKYDAAGNVTKVTDPKLQETDYAYDALSRLESVEQHLNQVVAYRYDDRGRLLRVVNARSPGPTLRHVYEAWGGLVAVEHYPSEADAIAEEDLERTVSFDYDLEGNLTLASDDDEELDVSAPLFSADPVTGYDARNRLREHTVGYVPGDDVTFTATYNRFGERTGLEVTQGSDTLTHTWTFDAQGRLDTASLPGTSALDFTPFPDDTLETLSRGSGVITDYTYLPEGPIDTITVSTGSTQLLDLDYTVNAVLNVTDLDEQHASTDPTESYAYGYDGGNRLTLADYPAAYGLPADDGFGYDPAGNRETPGTPGAYDYDANNRLTVSPFAAISCYDDDGNLTSTRSAGDCTSGTVAKSFAWDTTNRLRSFSEGSTSAAYAYDPFGRRIQKTVGSTTTWYVWDGDRLLGEYSGSGSRQVRYAYAGGFAPAQVAYGSPGSETVYDVHTDHLDTPRLLTDASGAVAWRASYEAFGQAHLDSANTVTLNLRFPGEYFDAESGLAYNYHRYYDAAVGRYISADPIGQVGDVNVFAYAAVNPLNIVDPLGLLDFGETENLGLATSLGAGISDPLTRFGDFAAETYLGYLDLDRNRGELVDAENGSADKYFHCKGHCEACKEGPGGKLVSEFSSPAKEALDFADRLRDGEVQSNEDLVALIRDSADDIRANEAGQAAAERGDHCAGACISLAPSNLAQKYSSEAPNR